MRIRKERKFSFTQKTSLLQSYPSVSLHKVIFLLISAHDLSDDRKHSASFFFSFFKSISVGKKHVIFLGLGVAHDNIGKAKKEKKTTTYYLIIT